MLRRFEASPSRCPRLMGMASSGRERGALAIVQVRCRRISPVAADSSDRLLSEPTAGTQLCRREPLFIPHVVILSQPLKRALDQPSIRILSLSKSVDRREISRRVVGSAGAATARVAGSS